MTDDLKWIAWDGGPHILMEKRLAGVWKGADSPLNGRVVEAASRWAGVGSAATDYDRACDVNDYIGVIPVGDGQAVVIDREVPMSTWISGEDGSGYLVVPVEWDADEFDRGIWKAVRALPDTLFRDSGLRYSTEESGLLLFPACDSGPDWVCDSEECELPPGRYRISAANEVEVAETSLRVYRFHRGV